MYQATQTEAHFLQILRDYFGGENEIINLLSADYIYMVKFQQHGNNEHGVKLPNRSLHLAFHCS